MEGTLTSGKRVATGTTVSSSGTFGFINQNSKSVNYYIIQVAGLSFRPSTVIIYDRHGQTLDVIYNSSTELWNGKKLYAFLQGYNRDSTLWYSMEGNSNIYNDGFWFPAYYGNTSYKWIAYE